MKRFSIFRKGIGVTMAPAVIFDVYLYAKNVTLDLLLFLVPFLLLLGLIATGISYSSFKKLATQLSDLNVHVRLTLIFYIINIYSLISIIYVLFIKFSISYGYILLPIFITTIGAIILTIIVRVLRSSIKISTKILLLSTLSIIALLCVIYVNN